MKLVIASDLHGSETYVRMLLDRIAEEAPERIVLLGDLLYHGPRNDLPQGYDTKQVAALLNEHAARIVAVRGNCDAEVDQMVLDFPCMGDSATIVVDGHMLFCTHGHVFSPTAEPGAPDAAPPLPPSSAFLSGHTHVKTLAERAGVLYVNPGSVSLPKDGSRSFAVYENGTFTLKGLEDGEPIDSRTL